MGNKGTIYRKSITAKIGKRFFALLMVWVMIFGLPACTGEKGRGPEEIKPVAVERKPEPQGLQTANEATAIALRQYVYARLLTETFLTEDTATLTAEGLSEMAGELLLVWENAALSSSAAMELTNQAVLLLEVPTGKQTTATSHPQAGLMALAATPFHASPVAYAAESGRKIDPQTWAENLTRQYDALKGAKRYQQLAQQLDTDAKTAYEQMVLAQKIIRNAAELEEAEGVVNAYTESIHYLQGLKTTSKVAMLGWSMAATGGGSVALLEGAGLLVGGVDCIADVGETGSTLILGEDHQVTVAFGDIKETLGPVSSLIGLATLNPAEIGKNAKDTMDAVVYISDSLVDLFYEDKIVGIKVEGLSDQAVRISGEVLEASTKAAMEAAGFLYPNATKGISQTAGLWEPEPGVMAARMNALVSQMAELERAAGIVSEIPQESDGTEDETPRVSSVNMNIFGVYTCVATGGVNNETITSTVTLRNIGDGLLSWTDEDEDETTLSYNKETNIIHDDSSGLTLHIEFSMTGSTVIGNGYMSGTLWDEPVEETISLTKISD